MIVVVVVSFKWLLEPLLTSRAHVVIHGLGLGLGLGHNSTRILHLSSTLYYTGCRCVEGTDSRRVLVQGPYASQTCIAWPAAHYQSPYCQIRIDHHACITS